MNNLLEEHKLKMSHVFRHILHGFTLNLIDEISNYETTALLRYSANVQIICNLYIDYYWLRMICAGYLDVPDTSLRPGMAIKYFIDNVEKIDGKIYIDGLKVVCYTPNHDGIHCGNSKPNFHRHTYESFRIIF
jgi:hypothetical protein